LVWPLPAKLLFELELKGLPQPNRGRRVIA
jgi:hypothetical protein